MRLAIDTNAYTALMAGHKRVLELLETADEIVVPAVVAGELMAGFLIGTRTEANVAELRSFLDRPGVSIKTVDIEAAERYGALVRNLRAAGTPIPTNDLWIAATALAAGAALLTRDRRFETIAGLFVLGF